MGNADQKMLGKELKLRGNHEKRLKSVGKIFRQFFVYCGAIFALPGGALFLVTAVRFLGGQEALSIDYSGAKYAYPALPLDYLDFLQKQP